MKAVTWHGKEDVRVDNVPDPKIEEPTDAIVRIALVAGLEVGELEVVRGAEDRSAMTQMSREQPRRLDEQVASMKGELEAAVADHSSM